VTLILVRLAGAVLWTECSEKSFRREYFADRNPKRRINRKDGCQGPDDQNSAECDGVRENSLILWSSTWASFAFQTEAQSMPFVHWVAPYAPRFTLFRKHRNSNAAQLWSRTVANRDVEFVRRKWTSGEILRTNDAERASWLLASPIFECQPGDPSVVSSVSSDEGSTRF
jgi:hypothetical protein